MLLATHGYFTSNRKGKGGDDIYSFTKLSITIEINVFDEDTQMPLEAADVFTPCSEVQNFLTNQNGKVIMELPLDKACDFAAATEFIIKLPKGFETKIGENGVRVSGGQKQRISIARAILKKSPIILLDEATSSLDADSEQVVQNAISSLVKNKTTLVIAHRLSTIHSADKIFVLKDGCIVDSGNHDSLMKSSNEYKSLYEKQLLIFI